MIFERNGKIFDKQINGSEYELKKTICIKDFSNEYVKFKKGKEYFYLDYNNKHNYYYVFPYNDNSVIGTENRGWTFYLVNYYKFDDYFDNTIYIRRKKLNSL